MRSPARARPSRGARAHPTAEGGFTLPELVVAMAILLIVLTSLASVLVSASGSEVDANHRFQAQEQARTAVSHLTRELHCASSVSDTNGNSLTAGTNYSAITANLPSTCLTSGGVALYVTWCTSASSLTTGDYALYRVTSTATPRPTCSSAGKVKQADYLTTSTPFCLPSTSVAFACGGVLQPTSSLPLLHVTMPVNLTGPSSTVGSYNLVDDIALRNGTRS
jgi:prepilin-type N-terminal cleavage/methylation domain-containing protein